MLVSNYYVYFTEEDDGAIKFTHDGIPQKVIIPKRNLIAFEIFKKHYDVLSGFKNRHYAIAKWIVRDIRIAGFDFKLYKDSKTIYKPVRRGLNGASGLFPELTKEEQLHWLLIELDLINQKLYYSSLENNY